MTPAAQERAQHTPGPWRVYEDRSAYLIYGGDQSSSYFASVRFWRNGASRGSRVTWSEPATARGDAVLIAAAPALLAACIEALPIMESLDISREYGDEEMPIITRLHAAIAQAKGDKQ